jgi:hypothetical protein
VDFIALFFDLLKGIAWPVAVVIVAVAFRTDIKALLPRIRRAGPSGVEFDPAAQQNSAAESRSAAASVLQPLPGLDRTPTIEALEKHLLQALAVVDESKKVALLVRLLAQARLEHAFALIYNSIFGSQIAFLRYLEKTVRASQSDAQSYMETAKARAPELYGNYGFGGWMSFLVSQGLVDVANEELTITGFGRDFLLYLSARKLSETKPL